MTPKIVVLPVDVADRIAAGEVVERPASVVKELVENALDAACSRVTVEIADAGRRLIRVTDDGEGMLPADAALAFQRHATSKIRTEEDLCRIRTLGFRGEALPSIAAVSKARLITMVEGAPCGIEVRLEGGSLKEQRDVAAAPGTMVEAADLFYNTPARKKFLKSPATEFGHICQMVQRQALAFPAVHFRLSHNGAVVAEYSPARSLRDRVQQVYGLALVDACVQARGEEGSLRLDCLCARPLATGVSRTPQEIFVNGRGVKSPIISHAVYEGYGTYLAKGHHPRFVLFLSMDPRCVDANVHPAKREVRFVNQEQVHGLVRASIKAAVQSDSPDADRTSVRVGWSHSFEPKEPHAGRPSTYPEGPDGVARAEERTHAADPVQAYLTALGQEVRAMGQIADRYILAQVGEELQIVDQHTAHERVLFERLRARFEEGAVPSQQTLLPQTVELPAHAAVLLQAHDADLARFGFEVEGFGGGAFLIRAVPGLLEGADPAAVLRALVEDWESELATLAADERYAMGLASIACHSAVRSGRKLEGPEMRRLLEDWHEAGLPSTCPHGRRIAMRLTIEELDRIFGRQGWEK